LARKKFDLDKVDLEQPNRKPNFPGGPCSACEKEARLLARPAPTKDSKNNNGLLPSNIYEYAAGVKDWAPQRGDDPDRLAFHGYLHQASYGDDDAALTALQQVLNHRPERLWHPYVQSQFRHLIVHGAHPDLPRKFRDQANEALVGLVQAWVVGLGYWATINRSPSGRGQTPLLFPLIREQEGLHLTPEGALHAAAAGDFCELWRDLKDRLTTLPWKATRNEYRDVTMEGKAAVVAEFVEQLKPILHDWWTSHHEEGRHRLRWCTLTGDFPSDDTLGKIIQKSLRVPTGRNPGDTLGYEFLGRLKFNIGGLEMPEEWLPRSASPSLIKSTLRTLRKNPPSARSKRRRRK
jgi:hypothetical protein